MFAMDFLFYSSDPLVALPHLLCDLLEVHEGVVDCGSFLVCFLEGKFVRLVNFAKTCLRIALRQRFPFRGKNLGLGGATLVERGHGAEIHGDALGFEDFILESEVLVG